MSSITLFLSYSSKDHFFATLAEIKLSEAGIHVWRDMGQLRAGTDWRLGIERGIANSHVVLVALSSNSSESSYVTYEWAYALGKGKPIIPVKLEECRVHPKLEAIQYLDFSVPGAAPWESLIDEILEIEIDKDAVQSKTEDEIASAEAASRDPRAKAILSYLNQRGYQMASFERLRSRIDEKLEDKDFEKLIRKNKDIFRKATLKGDKPGLAKLVP